jgi:hypothetical protein
LRENAHLIVQHPVIPEMYAYTNGIGMITIGMDIAGGGIIIGHIIINFLSGCTGVAQLQANRPVVGKKVTKIGTNLEIGDMVIGIIRCTCGIAIGIGSTGLVIIIIKAAAQVKAAFANLRRCRTDNCG